ncbi:MAG: beta-phosphoglucomutase [Oscillospiraceae bacterium]|nr:beta-phosphoglucomutase [Oscillospiraceae bacterium]
MANQWSAVLFDLDGVLCFTDEYHYLAWKRVTDELGIPFDRAVNNRLRGLSRMDSLDIILEQAGRAFTRDEKEALAARKNDIYRGCLAAMSPADLSGDVRETLDALRARGYRLAVGSSSKNAPFILERLGLGGFFDAVADGNLVARSKPDPEVFLKAAELLGEQPERSLLVEDAVAGAEAAHRGGMRVACVGDAAAREAGDYNMASVRELLEIL